MLPIALSGRWRRGRKRVRARIGQAGKAGGAEALVVFDQSIGAIQVPYFLTKPGFEHDFITAAPGIVD